MKSIKRLFALSAVAIAVASPVANADYMATFQGATFTIHQVDSNTFTFDIAGANALSGDWLGATYLLAFDFKDLGIDFSASGVSATATYMPSGPILLGYNAQLNANICNDNAGETGSICFDPTSNIAVAADMLFTIDITGATLAFASTGPHLQILWGTHETDICPSPHHSADSPTGCENEKIGTLYSQNIGSSSGSSGSSSGSSGQVPEPSSNLLTLLGVGLLGATMWSRRRTRRA